MFVTLFCFYLWVVGALTTWVFADELITDPVMYDWTHKHKEFFYGTVSALWFFVFPLALLITIFKDNNKDI